MIRPSLKAAASVAALTLFAASAHAQDTGTPVPVPAQDQQPAAQETQAPATADSATDTGTPVQIANADDQAPPPPSTDILSGRTLSLLFDARLVAANGEKSFVDKGFGKTRFSGAKDGGFSIKPEAIEADLIWTPRFTNTLAGNVSATWQRDQENTVDLMEAFVTWIPPRGEHISFSAKAGLYWPEISLEHATGGAWSTVHTLTPSAINAWIGEEIRVIGAEATVTASIGQHDVAVTGGIFGYDDTAGTLLSFRGWGLHDLKATAFGHIQLPVLSPFMTRSQAGRTLSLLEIDNRAGFYGRVEWRPPLPFTINAYYYDNRGDPTVVNADLQWGWRTRFANVGLTAELAPGTKLLAQYMLGTTQMGIIPRGLTDYWVDTRYESAYVLVAHEIGKGEVTLRGEYFDTDERGSRMDPSEGEVGGAVTLGGRWAFTNQLTGFAEVLHVRSNRGVRIRTEPSPFEAQTVFQLGLRLRL